MHTRSFRQLPTTPRRIISCLWSSARCKKAAMPYSQDELRTIFQKTDERCHLCWKGLRLNSYGLPGGWEVEHSIARSNGGTDRLNNLFPAHITCNREKGTKTTRTARSWHGRTRAPLS